MKRSITCAFVVFMAASCGGDGGTDCGPFPSTQFDITGIDVKPVTYDELPSRVGSLVTTNALDANSVNNGQLILQLNADTQTSPVYLASNSNKSFEFNFSLISSAYACSPPAPYTNEQITRLNITSDSDFSADFPAGTNLNALFTVEFSQMGTPKHSNNGETTAYSLDEFVDSTPSGTSLLQLRLIQMPDSAKSHQFTVDYMHTDGEQYTVSTVVVNFE